MLTISTAQIRSELLGLGHHADTLTEERLTRELRRVGSLLRR